MIFLLGAFASNLVFQPSMQSVATFFSQVMAAIGGNTAGPGRTLILSLCVNNLFG